MKAFTIKGSFSMVLAFKLVQFVPIKELFSWYEVQAFFTFLMKRLGKFRLGIKAIPKNLLNLVRLRWV